MDLKLILSVLLNIGIFVDKHKDLDFKEHIKALESKMALYGHSYG